MNLSIERDADVEQTMRVQYEGALAVNFTLEDIPQEMDFSVGFSDNYFEYKASDEFNASLIVELDDIEYVMLVEYLPRHLKTQFTAEGSIYLYMNSRVTRFILANDRDDPTNYFLITNLTGEAIIQWDVGSSGYIIVDGFVGMHVEIKAERNELYFRMYSILQTEHFEIRWNLYIPGSIFIDTNMEWVSYYSFNLTIGDVVGVLIEANFLKANDWMVSWQTTIPIFIREGTIQFLSLESFMIMVNGTWYTLF